MDRQGERVAHADVPHPARTDRGVDQRHPKRAARLMERAPPDPGRSGGPEDVRCRLDRDAPRSQPAAGRPRARRRRGLLGPRRTRALRCARVVLLHAIRRALHPRAHRDPGGPPRANLGGAAGAGVEPASVTAPTIMRKGNRAIGAVLALLSLPVLLVLVDAVSFRVANRPNGSFMSSGRTREYVLYVPRSYDRAKPTPLVISLHGAGMWGAAQKETSRWNRVADEHGFIVVYPSGEGGGGPRVWQEGDGAEPSRDVRFISELIDTLEVRYNIDPRMIYANGLSNGGGMSFALSCTLSVRIAAVGMVGAALLLPFRRCTDQRPVPMIAFHGTADSAAPYKGGFSWVAPTRFQGVRAFTASWARRNRCATTPVDSVVATDVTRLEYTKCADDAAVVLYTIEGGGHTWPGGQPLPEWVVGPTSTSIDATSLMWAFFREHLLREAQTATRRN